jgi:hypothetical protein
MPDLTTARSLHDLPAVIHAQSHYVLSRKNKNFFVKNEYSTAHLLVGVEEMGLMPAT